MLVYKSLIMIVLYILNCDILIIFKRLTTNLMLLLYSYSFDFPTVKYGRGGIKYRVHQDISLGSEKLIKILVVLSLI